MVGSLRTGSLEVLAMESTHSIVWELHLESSSFIHSGTQMLISYCGVSCAVLGALGKLDMVSAFPQTTCSQQIRQVNKQ